MKTLFSVLLLSTAVLSFAAEASVDPLDAVGDRCAPGDVIYYGQNLKHTKEVLICQYGTNVFYSFGKVGQKAELDIKSDNIETTAVVVTDDVQSSEYLYVPNGNITYRVGYTGDLLQPGKSNDAVYVFSPKQEKPIAVIELDPNTVVNGIRNNFVE